MESFLQCRKVNRKAKWSPHHSYNYWNYLEAFVTSVLYEPWGGLCSFSVDQSGAEEHLQGLTWPLDRPQLLQAEDGSA